MNRKNRRERGNAVVEVALIFLPLMMTLLGTFEVARGMWMYHTLASAVKVGTRYAVVHGQGCADADAGCTVTVGDIATSVKRSGTGLDAAQLALTLSADGATQSCTALAACLSNSTQWPPSEHNVPGLSVTIRGVYHFRSVLTSLWPGQSSASLDYVAQSTQDIEF